MAELSYPTPKTTNPFYAYVCQRIGNNKNMCILVVGEPGTGKSLGALRICEQLNPLLTGKPFSSDQVVFSGLELMRLINSGKLQRGSCIIWDETGINQSSREWQSTSNKLINFLMQTFRHRNYVLIMTVPDASFIDAGTRKLINCLLESIGIDYTAKEVIFKPLMVKVNRVSGQVYHKYLLYKEEDRWIKLMWFHTPLAAKELRDAYEIKKKAFTDKLNARIMSELEAKETKRTLEEEGKRPLTEAQQRVYDMLKEGIKPLDIANELAISLNSVYVARKHIIERGHSID